MKHYCEDKQAVLEKVGSSSKGLSKEEAVRRLEVNGKNKLEAAPGKLPVPAFRDPVLPSLASLA